MFSMEEPSALIQEQGGPCAIIASVQVCSMHALRTTILHLGFPMIQEN